MKVWHVVIAVLLAGAGGCASLPDSGVAATPLSPEVERGRRLVGRGCAGCHTVNPDRSSIHRAAPPLWAIPGLHTPESLQRAIGTSPPHDPRSMPSVVLTRSEAADVIAYIDALARADARTRRLLDIPPCIATSC